jgi:hypothetical protein
MLRGSGRVAFFEPSRYRAGTVPFANATRSTHVVTPADEVSSAGALCVLGFGWEF